jgi:Uma2 family endonuclease
MPLPNQQERYTYQAYLDWPEGEKWELVDGIPYAMSPALSRIHQEICGELFLKIKTYLQGKSCKVYTAPFDVRLCKEEISDKEIVNVVQPDIIVICNKNMLDDKGAKGVPDFVVEIVSPSSAFLDYVKKLNLYGEYGVREYWIIDPKKTSLFVYQIDETGKYGAPNIYDDTSKVEVGIFRDLVIDLGKIFT